MTSPSELSSRGKLAYSYFHSYALARYPNNYQISIDGAESEIVARAPKFFEILGKYCVETGLPESQIKNRMETLAELNKGKLPSKLSLFIEAVSPLDQNNLYKSWPDTFKLYVSSVGEGLSDTARSIGEASASGLKLTGTLLPFALAGGILMFAFIKAKA